jgi:CHRD domain
MKRTLIALSMLALSAAACDDAATPTTPTADNTIRFTATLSAANEVPPVTNAESAANGSMTITFNLTRDAAGTITAATAVFSGTFAGFPAGTALTAAHIHPGFAGVNGGFVVNTALAAGEITFPAGTGSLNKTVTGVTADVAAGIIANPAGFYFNAHTALNPGGAVRGQLVRVQ